MPALQSLTHEETVTWLNTNGFSQYEKIFRNANVTGDMLSILTDVDLKEIGIFTVGHRKSIL